MLKNLKLYVKKFMKLITKLCILPILIILYVLVYIGYMGSILGDYILSYIEQK